MSQQPPDNFSPSDRSQWYQQVPQRPRQSSPWYEQQTQAYNQSPPDPSLQQPAQPTWQQQDFAQSSLYQPLSQPSGQSQWYQQPTQVPPGQPTQSPQSPQQPRRTLWQRYRKSRPAQIGSVLLLLLLIASLVLALFHTSLPIIGGNSGGTGVNGGSASIKVDFGGKQDLSFPISPTFLGVGGLGITNVINQAAPYLPQASLRLTRFGGFIPSVFPTEASATDPSQQVWGDVDSILSVMQQNHLLPIVTLSFSPSWLQPQNQNPPAPNTCLTNPDKADPSHVQPTFTLGGQNIGPQKWGQLAAQTVAHIDSKFPGLHPLYEIWNEPDGIAYWCEKQGDPNAAHERLVGYEALYAAAAPLMKQQAQQDGVQIKVGGPALAFVEARATTWITSLVNNPNVAPYLDFISYHQYANATTWKGLVSKTQDPKVGYIAEYQLVASIVHSGQQPDAHSTPIYIDEYNGNPCNPNLCRNDPTYAPVWNALFIADLLNSVSRSLSSKGTASAVPTGVVYFTWSSTQFCMFGAINANLDCTANGNAQAYPQYYTYKLLGGANYLNIAGGAYAVSNASSDKNGVVVAGFFTQGHDNILIVNTTGNKYTAITVLAQNPGESATSGTLYTLNKAHPNINSQQITIQQSSDGASATIDIPPYTTLAISF